MREVCECVGGGQYAPMMICIYICDCICVGAYV